MSGARLNGGRKVHSSISTESPDPAWDNFLRATKLGQFQQSSLWSQYKRSEGWQCVRVTFKEEEQIVGGFQVLWKATRLGRIGFVNKGPVLLPNVAELDAVAADSMIALTRTHRFAALIAQPPDEGAALTGALEQRGFSRNPLLFVMDASVWIDLSETQQAWESRLPTTRRNSYRRAIKLGATVREGGESDVPPLFELMESSCRRQGVRPNPPNAMACLELFRAFRQSGKARILIAVCKSEPVAGLLDIKFGDRYTGWKKGWNGRHAEFKPNILLTMDSVRWAREMGCARFDFAGITRSMAEAVLAEQPLTEAQIKHYDSYKLGFAGRAVLLPPAMIYCRNPLLRLACRQIAAYPRLAAQLRRLAKKF